MIRNDLQLKREDERLCQSRKMSALRRKELEAKGWAENDIEQLLGPSLCLQSEMEREITEYYSIKNGKIPTVGRLDRIGDILIAARIARGWSQEDLARELEVSPAAICQDEKSGYRGTTAGKAQRILDCLGVRIKVSAESLSIHEDAASELIPGYGYGDGVFRQLEITISAPGPLEQKAWIRGLSLQDIQTAGLRGSMESAEKVVV